MVLRLDPCDQACHESLEYKNLIQDNIQLRLQISVRKVEIELLGQIAVGAIGFSRGIGARDQIAQRIPGVRQVLHQRASKCAASAGRPYGRCPGRRETW